MIPSPSKVLAAEDVVDRWYDLVPREGKAKDKDNVAGKVALRSYRCADIIGSCICASFIVI